MHYFFSNLFTSLAIYFMWFLCGIGPGLLILPKGVKRFIFVLAPLLGMCFITLIQLYQITILLQPLAPRTLISILILCSLLITFIKFPFLKKEWRLFIKEKLHYIFIIPSLFILMYAWMFHVSGFHLVVGSSDPLQYCENARHILEILHTGSPLDAPIARQDHFVYEMTTRVQPYLKTQRRGAEVILATNKAISPLTFQEAFPVTMLCAFLTLALTLAAIGKVFFKLSLRSCIFLQIIFLSSFYLLLLHIQGSLAMSLGMAPGLLALALLTRTIYKPTLKWMPLTLLILATYVSIYSEPTLFNILLPIASIIIFRFWQKFSLGLRSLATTGAFLGLIYLIATYAVISVISTAVGNVLLVSSNFLQPFMAHAATDNPQHTFFDVGLPLWNLAGVVMGATSYYDSTHFNSYLSLIISEHTWTVLAVFFIMGAFACMGYFKTKNHLARFFAIPLLLWLLSSLITSNGIDYLRFARSLHYAMPFILLGLVLLAVPSNKNKGLLNKTGMFILIIFFGLNSYTIARTINFITSHNMENDPILVRFNEHIGTWEQLKKALSPSSKSNKPVLITGYNETIRPLAISIILQHQPHVLGTQMLDFWKLYDYHYPPYIPLEEFKKMYPIASYSILFHFNEQKSIMRHSITALNQWVGKNKVNNNTITQLDITLKQDKKYEGSNLSYWKFYSSLPPELPPTISECHEWWLRCNTRLTEKQLTSIQQREGQPWYRTENSLINASDQAIVPIDGEYPAEWKYSKDIFAPHIQRLQNIGDIMTKDKYSLKLPSNKLSKLLEDKKGLYRILFNPSHFVICEKDSLKHKLIMQFEGKTEDLTIKNMKQDAAVITTNEGLVTLSLITTANELSKAIIAVSQPVKIRKMAWVPADNI